MILMDSIRLDHITNEDIRKWYAEIKQYNEMHDELSELENIPDNTRREIVEISNYLISVATKNEPQITLDLEEIIDGESYLVDKEYRLKKRKRLEEKIYHKMLENGGDYIKIANKIYDIIRYTVIVDYDNYVSLVDTYLHDLEDYGYKVTKVKNRWDDVYCKGIAVLLTNNNGAKFEVQFHTRENYDTKEVFSREPYNLTRRNNVPTPLLVKASLLRKIYHSKVRVPKGAIEYSFKSNKKSK